jgi:hypothetical protein
VIVEIKPGNPKAEALGEEQADAYVKGLKKWYRARGDEVFQGGFALLSKCVSTDKKELEIEFEVEPYSFCPRADQLAPELPHVNPTIPS